MTAFTLQSPARATFQGVTFVGRGSDLWSPHGSGILIENIDQQGSRIYGDDIYNVNNCGPCFTAQNLDFAKVDLNGNYWGG